MLSNPLDDEERFRGILDAAISKGEVGEYNLYVNETQASKKARMKKARREAELAEHQRRANAKYQSIFGGDGKGTGAANGSVMDAAGPDADVNGGEPLTKRQKKSMRGHGDLGNLAAMIQLRSKARGETFFDDLEAKYGAESATGKGTKRKAETEPDEEAFQKTKAKLAKAKADREEKAISNGKAGQKAKAGSRGRNAKAAAAEEEKDQEEEEEDGDVDLEKESEAEEQEAEPDDESEEEKVKTKSKPNLKAKVQKGKANKSTAPAAKRNTRSRVKK